MGATVAMEHSIEFRLLGFYTLCLGFIQKYLILGSKMNKGLTGLEQHKGE